MVSRDSTPDISGTELTFPPKKVLSALLAPILIRVGSPVNPCKLAKVLRKKLFGMPLVVSTQLVHRSPSIERDMIDGDT